jgi:hypothetical protein
MIDQEYDGAAREAHLYISSLPSEFLPCIQVTLIKIDRFSICFKRVNGVYVDSTFET